MKAKFEIRSPRVKGLSFHPQLPWLLCGLHNGVVQIWDYEMKTLIDAFTDHSGSVRGVDFHKTQPIFVTGADDFLVKVWNYKLRRCLYTLTGHTDFVRTTFFHLMQPWIVSASDDFTVRIWNWQSRSSVACLPGHNHYVMCAQFHRSLPLLASVSLDKTLRVWDLSPLQRQQQPMDAASQDLFATTDVIVKSQIDAHEKGVNWVHWLYPPDEDRNTYSLSTPTDVNSMLATAADDGRVRVWRLYDDNLSLFKDEWISSKNVCCVTNYARFVLTCSEDRQIREFIMPIGNSFSSYQPWLFNQRETDRYWIICVHPTKHLIAAGHDTGFQIFKLFSERVPFELRDNYLYYGEKKHHCLIKIDTHAASSTALRTTTSKTAMSNMSNQIIRESNNNNNNNTSNSALLKSIFTFHKNERYSVDEKEAHKVKVALSTDASVTCYYLPNKVWFHVLSQNNSEKIVPKSPARTNFIEALCFYGPREYVYLTGGQLYVVNNAGETKLELLGGRSCQKLFAGPPGTIVCYMDDSLYLIQVAQQAILAKVKLHAVKHVMWDNNYSRIVCFNKSNLTVLTRRFKVITTVSELNTHIKSAVFDDKLNIIFFNTLHHLKCCNLFNGEVVTVSSTKSSVPYLVKVVDHSHILVCPKVGGVALIRMDIKECLLKYYLQQHTYRDAINVLRHTPIKGNALIGYLHKNGFSELALLFISDLRTRFNLSLECGDFGVAKETACELNTQPVWSQLSNAAAMIGDFKLAQYASAKAEDVAQSALLSLVTGDYDALRRMCKRDVNPHLKMQYALCIDDVETRIRVLMESHQYVLAYLTAKGNGYLELAKECEEHIPEEEVKKRVIDVTPITPRAISEPEAVTDNWPLLPVNESVFTRLLTQPEDNQHLSPSPTALKQSYYNDYDDAVKLSYDNSNINNNNNYSAARFNKNGKFATAFAEENDKDIFANDKAHVNVEIESDELDRNENGGWDEDEDDLDIHLHSTHKDTRGTALHDDSANLQINNMKNEESIVNANMPANITVKVRPPVTLHWINAYHHPACFVVAGEFDSALALLAEQIGLINPLPLQPYMQALWVAVNVARPSLLVSGVQYALAKEPNMRATNAISSPLFPNYSPLLSRSDELKRLFTEGRFVDSRTIASSILHQAVFVFPSDDDEEIRLRGVVDMVAEYARALEMQLYLRGSQLEPTEALKLALYLTHFNLVNEHKMLVIGQAMSKTFKTKNYLLASYLARRLLELNPSAKKEQQARAIIAEAQRNPTNAMDIQYDASIQSLVCVISYVVIPQNEVKPAFCPYCKSPAMPEFAGKLCPICTLSALSIEM